MIKAILIDDEPLARGLVKEYLSDHPDINIVAECGDGFEGVKAITQHQPDLIFLDILYHTLKTSLQCDDLAIHCVVDSVYGGDSITNRDNGTNFLISAYYIIILYLFF